MFEESDEDVDLYGYLAITKEEVAAAKDVQKLLKKVRARERMER